jgi:hypothetical protein
LRRLADDQFAIRLLDLRRDAAARRTEARRYSSARAISMAINLKIVEFRGQSYLRLILRELHRARLLHSWACSCSRAGGSFTARLDEIRNSALPVALLLRECGSEIAQNSPNQRTEHQVMN